MNRHGQRPNASRDQGSAVCRGGDGAHRKAAKRTHTRFAQFQHRTEQNLAEITDKLNGLIGYVAGQRAGGRKQ